MTRPKQAIPTFRDLLPGEVHALLSRNHVGRIAYSFHDSVDMRPIHYVYNDGWLYGRTSPGDKLITLRHNQWVAFEVDEISGPLDWKSAVIRGTFYHLDADGSEYDVRTYEHAVRLIRELAPATLAPEDPFAFRSEFFGISIDTVTGRASSTGHKA